MPRCNLCWITWTADRPMADKRAVILISANSEWRAVKEILSPVNIQSTLLGETFNFELVTRNSTLLTYFHGGWGKISAAATTQYAIDHYHPDLLINLGTCGGFEGRIQRGTIILVTRTIVYDIIEQMSNPDEAITHYSTEIDLSWLKDGGSWTVDDEQNPKHDPRSTVDVQPSVVHGLLVSADRDIVAQDIPMLIEKYDAVAADWESGAIAWVAKMNSVRCLILRGVTDLVSPSGGEAYGNIDLFHENTKAVMKKLIEQLPGWLARINWAAR
jgi:adenosylhomocysteine nucleosidase